MIDVSVILPTFNRLAKLSRALDSALAQANVTVECIVIDDCSTDGTTNFIRENYTSENIVLIEKTSRNGPQISRNMGLAVARGEYIIFFDSDDYLEPQSLSGRVNILRKEGVDTLFSGYFVNFMGKNWQVLKKVSAASGHPPANYCEALKNFKIAPTGSIMFRRNAFTNLELDENLISGHDDDLSLKLIRRGNFKFENSISMTLVQDVGEHIATPKRLMMGDAQLLQKYSDDILAFYGRRFLIIRKAKVFAGLLSVGEFKYGYSRVLFHAEKFGNILLILIALVYLPHKFFQILRRNVGMFLIRHFL